MERILESECEGVVRASVVGVPDPLWGEVVVAFLQTEVGRDIAITEVHSHCRDELSRYKLPRYIIQMGAADWPNSYDGTLNKYRLQELAQEDLARRATIQGSASEVAVIA